MKEIAFAINPQETIESGSLVVDLIEVVREGASLSFLSSGEKHPLSYWQALTRSPAEREGLDCLIKEELLFMQKETGKTPSLHSYLLRQIRIPPSRVGNAIQWLAPTQKIVCDGKVLVTDLFGTGEFYYEGNVLAQGELEIRGKIRWKDRSIELDACKAIIPGNPNWIVAGITLKRLGTHVKWKRLRALHQGPMTFAGAAKQLFLDEMDPEDPDEPKLLFKEGSLEEAHQGSLPYPVLLLKDRWGACADLWMDYGNGLRIAQHDRSLHLKDDQGNLQGKRQMEAEADWEKDLLETDYIKKNVGSSHYYCPVDKVPKSLTFLIELGWKVEDFQGRQILKQSGSDLAFEERKSAIALTGTLKYGDHQADINGILGAFNRRDHFIELSAGAIGILPADQTLRDLAEESEMSSGERVIKKSRMGILSPLLAEASLSGSLQDLRNKLQDFSGLEKAVPSSLFQGSLRAYQQQGVDWLAFLFKYGFHGILADEMGLGKTVQILAFLSRLPPDALHLIVMPTSLLFNWRNEINRFLPSFKCTVHQGGKRTKDLEDLQNGGLVLASYAALRLDLPLLEQLEFSTVILDEAQMIKNAHTQSAQAACRLDAQLKICLTGTPVENRLQELWSLYHFLMPDLFGSEESFEAEIRAAESDRRYLERIRKKITPFLLMRRKQDVLTDLPDRIDQTVWIEMTDDQKAFYDQLLAGFKSGVLKKAEADGVGKHRMEILEALLRLRQVCCHPLLLSSLVEGPPPRSGKFDALLEDLETISSEGHKALVYSQFTSMLKLMVKEAKERNWTFGYLDGNTPNREEVVKQFQEDPSQTLFFVSLKAGGVGLNLTAADYVYLFDPWWNEAVEEQAINRAHRIGRKDVVISKRFITTESVEEKMMKLKSAKKLMIDELLSGDASPSQLTIEDLQFLFS